jgi:hypothetical protein
LPRVPDQDLVDLVPIDAAPLERGLRGNGAELSGMNVPQSPAISADRRARGACNHD